MSRLVRSEQLKRKKMASKPTSRHSSSEEGSSSSEEEEMYFLVLFVKENNFSVVSERNLTKTGNDTGVVKYRNVKYDVTIIKRGKNFFIAKINFFS